MPYFRYLEKQAKPANVENREEETPQQPCEVDSPRPENKYKKEIEEFWDDFKQDPLFSNMVKYNVKKRHLKSFKKNINKDQFLGE